MFFFKKGICPKAFIFLNFTQLRNNYFLSLQFFALILPNGDFGDLEIFIGSKNDKKTPKQILRKIRKYDIFAQFLTQRLVLNPLILITH